MTSRLNHARRNGWSASAEGRQSRAEESLHGLGYNIPASPSTIAHYQAQLAEIKAHPDWTPPAFLPRLEAQLASGVNVHGPARRIQRWCVALGIVEHDPRRAEEAARARRAAQGRPARHGIDRGTFKAGLARLDAAQASRPLKPPTRKVEDT